MQVGKALQHRLHQDNALRRSQPGEPGVHELAQPGHLGGQCIEFGEVSRHIGFGHPSDRPQQAARQFLVSRFDVFVDTLFAQADEATFALAD